MSKYILDSYAWIEYFSGSQLGKEVEKIIEKNDCYTSSLSVAEVTVKLLKGGKDPKEAYNVISSLSNALPVNHEVAYEAAELYLEKRKTIKDIGIVDVIIMIQARQNNLVIITGDDHFKDEKKVHLLKQVNI